MSYYLGLVGLGLLFVLFVHLYNRWAYYVFRKQAQSAEQFQEIPAPANPPKLHKTQSLKNDGGTTRSVAKIGEIRGLAGEAALHAPSAVGNPTFWSSALLKDQPSPKADSDNTPNEARAIERKIFILGMESLSAEALQEWFVAINKSSSLGQTIEGLSGDNQWHFLWRLDGGVANASLTNNRLQALLPISQLQLTFNLANRRGYLTAESWQTLMSVLENPPSAKNTKMRVSTEFSQAWLEDAKWLDHLCAEFDVQIALTLLCRESAGVSGGQISRESANEGMVFENGVFRKIDHQGRELFRLEFMPSGGIPENLDALENLIGQQMTFYLDIPRVANGQAVFKEMTKFAQHLAAIVRADLVDDRSLALSSVSLDTIGEQILQIQRRMKELGVPAGSPLALQLFS